MKDQSRVIAALLIGAAAGAVLGLLFAPDSGEGTRGAISDYTGDLVGKAKSKANDLKDYGNNAVDKVRSRFNSAADDLYNYRDGVESNVRDKANNIANDVQNHVDNAKARVKNSADNVNDSIQQA